MRRRLLSPDALADELASACSLLLVGFQGGGGGGGGGAIKSLSQDVSAVVTGTNAAVTVLQAQDGATGFTTEGDVWGYVSPFYHTGYALGFTGTSTNWTALTLGSANLSESAGEYYGTAAKYAIAVDLSGGLHVNAPASTELIVFECVGSPLAAIGPWPSDTAYGALWLTVSPGASNPALLSDGSDLFVNAASAGEILFSFGVTATEVATAAGHQFVSNSPAFGGGVGVIGITNAGTAPSSNPASGGILYATGGAGTWRGSSGTVTTFGPAELDGFKATAGKGHCPICGTDFAHEWKNESMGRSLTVCMWCLTEELGDRPFVIRRGS
jgi:hypothetical protein